MTPKPIHNLPLASSTLQQSLSRLSLGEEPTAQRRSTTFPSATPGVWARVNPLWATWPLRITKAEVEEMGGDIDNGGQVDAEDVLRRWDPVDSAEVQEVKTEGMGNGLNVMTSKFRDKLESQLLGISPSALVDSLPHLDVGDAVELCNGIEASSSDPRRQAREALTNILSGRHILVSNDPKDGQTTYGPWSTRYCGHQFGVWAGQLGDGRAISLLETESKRGGRQEIQVKGAGRTPFSRTADGLAVLRSGVREFLGCEAVAALGIPTTRSLALLTTTNLPVIRENGPEPPSLLVRLAPSFIRIGHFEALNPGKAGQDFQQIFFGGGWMRNDEPEEAGGQGPLGGQGNLEGLRELTEWCQGLMGMEGKTTEEFVKEVVKRNAEMVAGWQVYGWMHGVLNTDNISIFGLTIDYGPYAFMDIWNEGHICNHSDPSGLYSYRRQPERVLFALDKLVTVLSPIIGYENLHRTPSAGWSDGKTKDDVTAWNEKAEEVMKGWEEGFWNVEKRCEKAGWSKRFGLNTYRESDDRDIIFDYLTLLHTHSIDFHASLRHLSTFITSKATDENYLRRFTVDFVAECTINIPSDAVDLAVEGIKTWLEVYAKRVLDKEEVTSWQNTSVDLDEGLYGNTAVGKHEDDGMNGDGWEMTRMGMMKSVNPRFILRQWVLEELIGDMEKSLDNLAEGRTRLSRVLDMSTRPFHPWGQDADESEEAKERERLCGLGKPEMLGFQCSCSS